MERIIPYDLVRSAYLTAHKSTGQQAEGDEITLGEMSAGTSGQDDLRESMMADPLRDSIMQ